MSQNDRTLTSRYEWKYFVPASILPSIRAMVQPFVRPDHFARQHADRRYPIVSLYLDGDGLELYRTTVEGHRNRFKLRVRAYDDDPKSPVFLEVKKRSNVVVRKTRARVSREVAEAVLSGRPAPLSEVEGASEFALRLGELGARPLVRVRYMREAYESVHGDPVRFTIDTEVEHAMTATNNLALEAHRDWEKTPTEGAIVELKFSAVSVVGDAAHRSAGDQPGVDPEVRALAGSCDGAGAAVSPSPNAATTCSERGAPAPPTSQCLSSVRPSIASSRAGARGPRACPPCSLP